MLTPKLFILFMVSTTVSASDNAMLSVISSSIRPGSMP
jgi:hypothetical protein